MHDQVALRGGTVSCAIPYSHRVGSRLCHGDIGERERVRCRVLSERIGTVPSVIDGARSCLCRKGGRLSFANFIAGYGRGDGTVGLCRGTGVRRERDVAAVSLPIGNQYNVPLANLGVADVNPFCRRWR